MMNPMVSKLKQVLPDFFNNHLVKPSGKIDEQTVKRAHFGGFEDNKPSDDETDEV